MFTKQLFRSHNRALAAYRHWVTGFTRRVERHWLGTSLVGVILEAFRPRGR